MKMIIDLYGNSLYDKACDWLWKKIIKEEEDDFVKYKCYFMELALPDKGKYTMKGFFIGDLSRLYIPLI